MAYIFALSCLFPAQLALALKDCGTHVVVSCETHDDRHFVALHSSDPSDFKTSGPTDAVDDSAFPEEEHDAAHQIEKGKLPISTVSVISPEVVRILYVAQNSVAEIATAPRLRETKWPNGPPVLTSSFLRFLPSIRLQL